MNDYYICVRRFVASDPELPDSLYVFNKSTNKYLESYSVKFKLKRIYGTNILMAMSNIKITYT